MDRILRILILEDLPNDAELMIYELNQANIPHTYLRVEDREQFLGALKNYNPDLILSDFYLPTLEGLEALVLAQESCPEVPFIFVSGAMGEEVAIDAVQRGATDYVLKDRLSRLGPAVERALREAEERRQRRQAVAALRESEEKYRLLLKNIPSVVYKGFMDGAVEFVDEKVQELTGYPRQIFESRRKLWTDILVPEDQASFKQAFLEGLRGNKSYVREYRVQRIDGGYIWIQDRGQIILKPNGKVDYVSGMFFDITARKQVEAALLESQTQFTSFMSHLPGIAYMRDFQGAYVYVNETWERIHPDPGKGQEGPGELDESDHLVITRGQSSQIIEEIVQEDGIHNWLINKFPILDRTGRPVLIGAVGIDVTMRRRAEQALQESEQRLRFLASRLLRAQERERKRISMELHDELGQSLAALKLQIRAIEHGLRRDQQLLREECRDLLQYLDGVIDNIRRLSRDLSPAILEDLGLQSALKYLIDGVGKHYTVKHFFAVEDLDDLFPSEAQIIIYRIFQECLTNIAKHAGATEVKVAVKEEQGSLVLVLEDNGTGFDPSQAADRRGPGRGLGLAALDERTRMLGGTMEIRSHPGQGTRVICVIPIDEGRRTNRWGKKSRGPGLA
jgi:PAS domain S-box-containing protein